MVRRVGRGIALLFHDRGTRRGRVVSSTPPPHFTTRKEPVPILQEAGWVPEPVRTGGKSRPHRDSIPDRRARRYRSCRLVLFNSTACVVCSLQPSLGRAMVYSKSCLQESSSWFLKIEPIGCPETSVRN